MRRVCVVVVASALSFVLWSASAPAATFVPAPGSPYAPIGPVKSNGLEFLGGIVAGDFNEDGMSDLAVVDATGLPPVSPGVSVTVLLGRRTGGLVAAPGSPISISNGGEYGTGGEPIAAADFTGDGHLDLSVLDLVHGNVAILLGDGTGRFKLAGPPIPYTGGTGRHYLLTGDFNGDGRQDIAVVDEEHVTILLGTGQGGFTPGPGSPLTFSGPVFSAAVGDFTGDGRSDLAVGESPGFVRVFLPSPTGELQAAPGSPVAVGTTPSGMVAADLTGNGRLDLATANGGDDTASVLLGNGEGEFTPALGSPFPVPDGRVPEELSDPGSPESIGVGDFGCLGIPDLALANFNGSSDNVAILEGDGSGGFTNAPGSPFPANGNPYPLSMGDFNGDGAPDIAVANSYQGLVTVFEDTASGGSCESEPPKSHQQPPAPIVSTPVPQAPSPGASPSRIEVLSYAVRVIRPRRAIRLRFSLASPATVVAQLERLVSRRVHQRWHTRLARVGSFTIHGKAGANLLTIAPGRRLQLLPGKYEIRFFATLGAERSRVHTVALTLHR